MSEIDRLPIGDALASSALSRSAFYRRLTQAGIVPLKISGRSFLTGEHLQALTRLESWIDKGGDPEQWPGKLGELGSAGAPAGGALAPSSAPLPMLLSQAAMADGDPEGSVPNELVLAELDLLERLLPFLAKASEQGWLLPTSTVELLIGARPRGAGVDRFGYRFTAAGAHGREIAWAISRA